MASSAEQTLQQISDYIDKYEHDLALRESIVNLGNATTRQQIAMQKAHLADLKAKYAYLQTYYAQHGELPATVHFDAHTNDGAGMYRTEAGGEIKMVMLMAGPSGTQIVTAPDFTGTLSASNPDMPTSAYREGSHFGMQLGSYAYTGIDWRVTGTLFTGMHVAGSWYPGVYWSVQLNLGSNIELITGSHQMNAHMFQGGILFSLDADEVPTDSIWDYYNDDILPNINPDNAAFPDGYESPFNPDDPDDTPTTDPDTLPHDDGDTPLPFQEGNQIDAPSMFITQYICTKSDLTLLGVNLWSSWVDPNAGANTAKNFIFDYFQDTGTFNITTALDYIISLRVFPFAFSTAHVSVGVSDGIYIGTGHSNFTNQSLNVLNEVNGWIDAGKKKVIPEEPYNDFRDMYNCTIQLYMPFCGSLELNPVEVINREVSVRYYIDFQSACCTAVAFVQGDKGKYPIGSKSGQIGFTLPITATNSGQLAAQFASDATRALGTVGNFGMQMAKAALAASTAKAGGELAAAKSPEYASQISQSTSLQLKGINQGKVGSTGNLALDLANQAIDMLSRSGVGMPLLSGGGGCESLMFQAGCTIQIRRGKYVNLDDIHYGHMQGNALAETKPISEFSGFCKFAGVDTTGLTCHNDERNEILSLLESGVYV